MSKQVKIEVKINHFTIKKIQPFTKSEKRENIIMAQGIDS